MRALLNNRGEAITVFVLMAILSLILLFNDVSHGLMQGVTAMQRTHTTSSLQEEDAGNSTQLPTPSIHPSQAPKVPVRPSFDATTDKARAMRIADRMRRAEVWKSLLTPSNDTGWYFPPVGTCDLQFHHPENSTAPSKPRPRVAISLVLIQRSDLIQIAMNTLLKTDMFSVADVAVFTYFNLNNTGAQMYFRNEKRFPVVEVPNPSGTNQGIVIPRIELMKAMMSHGCNFQWFFEMHDDMVFYGPWFAELLAHDQPHYGILMPFIVNGVISDDDALKVIEKYSSGLNETVNVVYERCIQVHPWLLKREMIEDVGYYDPVFSPHTGEDDDLYIRVIANGWLPVAIRTSWALHVGGITRGMWLPPQPGYQAKLWSKHHVDITFLRNRMLVQCHPIVDMGGTNIRFPPNAAFPRLPVYNESSGGA